MTFWKRALAIITGTTLLASTLSPTPAAAQAAPISWVNCPQQVDRPGARCGNIEVPMDYNNPSGAKITVGFIYFAATGNAKDTIFTNPGGPNAGVYEHIGSALFPFPDGFFRDFNVVGVQPRGLVGSTHVECIAGLENGLTNLREACDYSRPGYTAALTTENTARDWEEVRKALALDSISIYGLSYGTILGSVYATMYPNNTNRVVLDSGVDTEQMWSQIMMNQEGGYTKALHDFFGWAASRNDTYGLGSTPYAVYRSWAEAVRQQSGSYPPSTPPAMTTADVPPHSSPFGDAALLALNSSERPRSQAESIITQHVTGSPAISSPLMSATRILLPMPRYWDKLAQGIKDQGVLDDLRKQLIGNAPQEEPDPNIVLAPIFMQRNIICNESTSPIHPELKPRLMWYEEIAKDPTIAAPMAFGSGAFCEGLPATTRVPALSGANLKVRPLQLQATSDPQTPYGNFWNMHNQMNSHLVTVHGPGHSAFAAGIPAVDSLVLDYLGGGTPTVTDLPGIFG